MSTAPELRPGGVALLTKPGFQALAIGAGAAIALAVALVYFFLAQPGRDEFCRASLEPGLGTIVSYTYDTWAGFTGRWTAMALYAAVLPGMDLNSIAYTVALLVLFMAWFAGFWLAVDAVFGRTLTPGRKLLLALLLLALFWCGTPSREGIYWLTGATEYGLPFFLTMLALRLGSRLPDARSGLRSALAGGLVAILAAGAHELAGILLTGAAAVFALALWRTGNRSELRNALILLACAGAGLALSAGAPGNFVRFGHYQGGRPLLAIALTLQPDRTPIGWLADGRLLALSLFLLALPAFRAARPAWTASALPTVLIVPAVSLASAVGGYFIASLVQGSGPAGRTADMLYAFFLVGWLASLVAIAAAFDLAPIETTATRLVGTAGAVLLAIGMATAPATAAAVIDLPYALTKWRQDHRSRLMLIQSAVAADRDDVIVPQIARIPAPLQDNGILADPDYWANRCAARYYHLDSIRTAADPGASDTGAMHRTEGWARLLGGS